MYIWECLQTSNIFQYQTIGSGVSKKQQIAKFLQLASFPPSLPVWPSVQHWSFFLCSAQPSSLALLASPR